MGKRVIVMVECKCDMDGCGCGMGGDEQNVMGQDGFTMIDGKFYCCKCTKKMAKQSDTTME